MPCAATADGRRSAQRCGSIRCTGRAASRGPSSACGCNSGTATVTAVARLVWCTCASNGRVLRGSGRCTAQCDGPCQRARCKKLDAAANGSGAAGVAATPSNLCMSRSALACQAADAAPCCIGATAAPRGLEESFVVLTGGGRGSAGGAPCRALLAQQQSQQQGLHDLFAVCARTFELASTTTEVHPSA